MQKAIRCARLGRYLMGLGEFLLLAGGSITIVEIAPTFGIGLYSDLMATLARWLLVAGITIIVAGAVTRFLATARKRS